jgi:alanyl-tRNA synthetase
MTERLYYTDPTLTEFDGRVVATAPGAIILDRTAFYPASGGQIFDTGRLESDGRSVRVVEVAENEIGEILHRVESVDLFAPGTTLHGIIDSPRRRDHMQQHTGQHLLSAVFIELFNAPTVSFHMGDDTCTIDLDAKSLSPEQIREAERRSNEIISDDVAVEIKFATPEEARQMGVRKIPPDLKDQLRLIEIRGHDLTACGGTHVGRTGEIGSILLRKAEKVKQGMRVEFVCGARAVAAARQDFETLTSAAALFSSHLYDVPEQIRKTLDEAKAAGKREQKTQAELAELMAARMLADTVNSVARVSDPGASQVKDPCHTVSNEVCLVKRVFNDRDLGFIKLLAQKLAAHPTVLALLATTTPQPALVFAQSAGGRFDMGGLMKEAMSALGGRGGGSHDLAQGGAPAGADVQVALNATAANIMS